MAAAAEQGDVRVIEFDFTNSRDQKLHCFKLLPPKGVPVTACLLWLHGFCSHTGRQLKGLCRERARARDERRRR